MEMENNLCADNLSNYHNIFDTLISLEEQKNVENATKCELITMAYNFFKIFLKNEIITIETDDNNNVLYFHLVFQNRINQIYCNLFVQLFVEKMNQKLISNHYEFWSLGDAGSCELGKFSIRVEVYKVRE